MKVHHYRNSQAAFIGLNTYFFNEEYDILKTGGLLNGNQMIAYDQIIYIGRAKVNPNFDFGNTFGYRKQKWSGLIGNYINQEDLLDLKKRVQEREIKKSKQYNISMLFYNKHKHGKNCLMSITLSRRKGDKNPIASFNIRSSEITKRLLMDLLLVQRILEYIYGHNKVSIILFVTNMYQDAEAFTMFDTYKNIKDLKIEGRPINRWQGRVLRTLTKFKICHIDEIKMKVHKRCVRQLQRPEGIPLSGDRPMLAKDLKINI